MKLSLLISMLALLTASQAQLTPNAGVPASTPAGGVLGGLGAPNIPGAPFSADTVSKSTHPLQNGSPSTSEVQGKLYRDSQGRTRRETGPQSIPGGAVSAGSIAITDPVQHVIIVLDPSQKTAHIYRWQAPVASSQPVAGLPTLSANLPPQRDQPQAATITASSPPVAVGAPVWGAGASVKVDNLGNKEMQGVQVSGTRTTRMIPTGTTGNGTPMISYTETWTSPELKLTLLTEIHDPRGGETVMKMMNLQRTDPDPSLFQVPSDYVVQDTANK